MNIFDALSMGKGRLNEENLSALLGYLLTPSQSHGIGHSFLGLLLDTLREDHKVPLDHLQDLDRLTVDVQLEERFDFEGKGRTVDLVLRFFNQRSGSRVAGEAQELHRIAIENKIRVGAADKTQLREEFLGIKEEIGLDSVPLTMIFLTPDRNSHKLREEYEQLTPELLGTHRKVWLTWDKVTTPNRAVLELLAQLLKLERDVVIPPMTEYLRHTLKAFVRHVSRKLSDTTSKRRSETGEVTDEISVEIGGAAYRLERYQSTTIKLFNVEREEYEMAKPLLRQLILERHLAISLTNSAGNEKNTRTLGREVLEVVLREQVSTPP